MVRHKSHGSLRSIACLGLAILLVGSFARGEEFNCRWMLCMPEVLALSDVVGVADILSVSRAPAAGNSWGSQNALVTCEFKWVRIVYRSPRTDIDESSTQALQFETDAYYMSTYRIGRYLLFVMQRDKTVFVPCEEGDEWDYRFISDGVYVPPVRRRELPECTQSKISTDQVVTSPASGDIAAMDGTNDGLTEGDRKMKGGVSLANVEEAIAAILPPDGEQVFEARGVSLETKHPANTDINGRYWLLRFAAYDLPCKFNPLKSRADWLCVFRLKGYCLRSQLETTEALPVGPEVWTTRFMIVGEWKSGAFMINQITDRRSGKELLRCREPAEPIADDSTQPVAQGD